MDSLYKLCMLCLVQGEGRLFLRAPRFTIEMLTEALEVSSLLPEHTHTHFGSCLQFGTT